MMNPDTVHRDALVRLAERDYEDALQRLRALGCEPAMVRQSELAFPLYKALLDVRSVAAYDDSESPDYATTSGGSVEWGPGYFGKWMSETHDLLESFRGTVSVMP